MDILNKLIFSWKHKLMSIQIELDSLQLDLDKCIFPHSFLEKKKKFCSIHLTNTVQLLYHSAAKGEMD